MRSITVSHVLNQLRPSGMERMLQSSARDFTRLGVTTVVFGQGDSHPFAAPLRDAGLDVRVVGEVRSLLDGRRMARSVARSQPDVVHVHSEHLYWQLVPHLAMFLPRTPIVRTVHNVFDPPGLRHLKRRLLSFPADRRTSAVIAVSEDVAEVERTFGRRPIVIDNWVDTRFFDIGTRRHTSVQRASHEPSVTIVGNSSSAKNHGLALRAVLQHPTLNVYFHGDESGATADEISMLDRLEAEGRLLHRGIGDPARSLERTTFFAMPSRHEGMPIALLEALASGVPCIVADSPGLSWARRHAGVTVVPLRQSDWTAAVAHSADNDLETPHADQLHLYRPSSGAGRHAELYRDAMERRGNQ